MSISDLKILNLEDNPIDAEFIHEKMISEGFTNLQIEVVSTEKEFIDRLNTNTYNLILSDYNLPGFNGLEALLMAKNICPEIPPRRSRLSVRERSCSTNTQVAIVRFKNQSNPLSA